MKILFIILMFSIFFNIPVNAMDSNGFEEITLADTDKKDDFFTYWQDYLPIERRNEAIYKYKEMVFSFNSDKTLIFTQIFDINACGVNNCPYKVLLKDNKGSTKEVLDGIGPDTENLFKVKINKGRPLSINVGDLFFDYDEREGKYVKK